MKQLFIIFPYLKTSQEISLFGINFFNNREIRNISSQMQNHLSILFDMFYLKDNFKLTDMVFSYLEYESEKEKEVYLSKLLKAQALITYIYSSPHPTLLEPFIKKEHTDFYVFYPNKISKVFLQPDNYVIQIGDNVYSGADEIGRLDGYEGKLNNENDLIVSKGSRIYPTEPQFTLRYDQNLYSDFTRPGSKLVQLSNKIVESKAWDMENFDERLFTSLKWYNRSLSWNATEDIELIHLAIALEALLGLKAGESVTTRFKESINLLVGPLTNLDAWLNQFYTVRSEIVHDGTSDEVMFNKIYRSGKNEKKSRYRSLVSYGRVIFMICLNAIVSGAEMAYHVRLSQLFVTNKERFEKICSVFDKPPTTPDNLINNVKQIIEELDKFSWIAEEGLSLDLYLSTLRYMAKNLLEISIDIPEVISKELKILAEKPTDNKSCYEILKAIYNLKKFDQNNLDNKIRIFLILNDVIWRYTMFTYLQYDKEFRDVTSSG